MRKPFITSVVEKTSLGAVYTQLAALSVVATAALASFCAKSGATTSDAGPDAGDTDVEVVPFSNGIELAWAVSAGGNDYEMGGVVLGLNGSEIALGGLFAGKAYFGDSDSINTTGGMDVLLASYDVDGEVQWITSAGSPDSFQNAEYGLPQGEYEDGSILVYGICSPGAIFGAGESNQTTLVSEEEQIDFVARFASDGSLVSAVEFGAVSDVNYLELSGAVLPGGRALISGPFSGTEILAEGQPDESTLVSSGGDDVLCVILDQDLNIESTFVFGGSGNDFGRCFPVGAQGGFAVGGNIGATATFGQGEANETVLTPTGGSDGFLARLSAGGELEWVAQVHGEGTDGVLTLSGRELPGGSMLVYGRYTGSLTFASAASDVTATLEEGVWIAPAILLARYSSEGEIEWAKRVSCAGALCDVHSAHPVSEDGDLVVTGSFESDIRFGGEEPNETEMAAQGTGTDIFIAFFNSDGTLGWARQDGGEVQDWYAYSSVLEDGSLAVGGVFGSGGLQSEQIVLGIGDPNETTLDSKGVTDFFLARYVPKAGGY